MSEFLIPILHQVSNTETPSTPMNGDIPTSSSDTSHTETPVSARSMVADDKQTAETQQPETNEELLAEIEVLKSLAYEKAYSEGLIQGKEEGLKQVSADMQQSLALLKDAEDKFKAQCQQYISSLDSVIAAIVFEAVLKIVGSEIKQPVNRAEIIQQVLAQYVGHPMLQVLVNPADIKALRQVLQNSDTEQAALETMIYPDSKVALGSCRIVFKESIINTDIYKQLQAFATHLSGHATAK